MIDYTLLLYGGIGTLGSIILAADLAWLAWRAVREIIGGPR